MGDRRNSFQRPERVAVVAERLVPFRQGLGPRLTAQVAEDLHERMPGVEPESIPHHLPPQFHLRAGPLGDLLQQSAEFLFDHLAVFAGQPATGPFQPAFLRVLIENLTRVQLPHKDRFSPRDRIGLAGEKAAVLSQPGHQFGRRVDDTRFRRGTQHLVHGGARPANGDSPGRQPPPHHGQHAVEVFGNQHGVTAIPGANQVFQLVPIAPRGLVQVVRGQQDASAAQQPTVAKHPQRLQHRDRPPLHVATARAGDPLTIQLRGHKRQMHGVEVPVELHHGPGLTGGPATGDGGCRGVSRLGPLDRESIAGQHVSESI